jgi:hypothetical protein
MTREEAEQVLTTIGHGQPTVGTGDRVRPLGCILMPSDGIALFLVDGSSETMVREAGELTKFPFDRIVESLQIMVDSTGSER